MKIDLVSDISCPWCAIGLAALEQALSSLGDAVRVDLEFQPFELNPDMPSEGQGIDAHLMSKYGATAEQAERTRQAIGDRGAELGVMFRMDRRSRIYNTFDAHRLLHWARLQGCQLALKHALFRAYFFDGRNPGACDVLLELAVSVGLDRSAADAVLAQGCYAREVREREAYYLERGVHAVPAVIVDDRHLIQGAQSVQAYVQVLRELAALSASDPA